MSNNYKVTLLRIGNMYVNPDRKDYLLDDGTEEEIQEQVQKLPTSTSEGTLPGIVGKCSPGSLAYTADGIYIFMLNNHDQWKTWVGNTGSDEGD